jgi:gliding motility-associated-like protein
VLTVVASSAGCPNDSDSVLVDIIPLPLATATTSSDSVCQGASATLTASGGSNYLWSPGGATDSVITVTPSATIEYTVDVTNSEGCTATANVTVNVIPAGIPDAGSNIIACLGDTVSLNGSQQNASGLVWSTSGDGFFLPGTTLATTTYIPGTSDTTAGFNFIYLETTGACLNLRDTLLINYTLPPTVYAGDDTLLSAAFNSGISLPLAPTVTNASNVVWSTSGTGFFYPSDTSLNATYEPSEADFDLDSIVLTLTVVGGCEPASDELVIEFSPFVIPNVFTPYPASPGKNDYFVINNLPSNSTLKIWDRWGVLVFESQAYENNWDAANLNSDTYYYVLISRGRDFHGWIQVLREE